MDKVALRKVVKYLKSTTVTPSPDTFLNGMQRRTDSILGQKFVSPVGQAAILASEKRRTDALCVWN